MWSNQILMCAKYSVNWLNWLMLIIMFSSVLVCLMDPWASTNLLFSGLIAVSFAFMELQTITITLVSSPNSQKAFQRGCVAIATCVVFTERSKGGGCKTQLCDWHPSHAEFTGLLSVICSNKQYNSTLRSGCILEYYVWYVFSSWKTVYIFISTVCHSLSDKRMACFSYTADMHFPICHTFLFLNLSDNFDVFSRLASN